MNCDTGTALLQLHDLTADPAGVCPVDTALDLLRRAAEASCGREVFCREGTRQVATILTDVTAGRGESGDLDLVEELCELVVDNANCDLASTAAAATLGLLRNNREEWELHLRRKRCSSLTCVMAFTVYIDPASCTAEGPCSLACPERAITGGPGEIHVIVADRCTKCLACVTTCPTGAIRKAGAIKPQLPATPVPVGSFGGADPDSGMRRRRRRGE
jgi:NADH-quinone oxidoreductase subunit F